jgi:hypothetical protein
VDEEHNNNISHLEFTEFKMLLVRSDTSDRRDATTLSRFQRTSALHSAGVVLYGIKARQSTFLTGILSKIFVMKKRDENIQNK